MKLQTRYTDISELLAIEDMPSAVAEPQLLLFNDKLADNFAINHDSEFLAKLLSGSAIDNAVAPVALGYSGHQFGHFSPRLGDGRAHLLGAITDQDGTLWDVQLKGAGATVFSRGGDGRCAIGPAVREYIMSEALDALGIATTRCLAVVTTGETVYRNPPRPGAVVTRLAKSHIRVGSFQYLATQGDIEGLEKLVDYAICCHFPEINSTGEQRYIDFLTAVQDKQIELIVSWMRVGFIHGVMNTDNTLISGETIDYGPCAMMNNFDFDTVFSSIDHQGRYAFGNQPTIANWNCARLAESLLLLFKDEKQALTDLSTVINSFSTRFNDAFNFMWQKKLGLESLEGDDHILVSELLTLMKQHKLDYTNTFNLLTESLQSPVTIPANIKEWYKKWFLRTSTQSYKTMRAVNPAVIPRNHNIEMIIGEYENSGKSASLEAFLKVISNPYIYKAENTHWYEPPKEGDANYQTFCGT
ncbi:protein adenylyltransferase SelO family protein [Pseudoalteromonas sp. L1]|uniref:protein adenylyltransferase SelO n=1 Tax=Pseudoalteromonas sp. L1 TaxID=195716 RepID=UPI001F32AF2B|nr:YdiU family protein [Pseudoalteromonas sp. L1]